jgi:formate dehydrogenase major subunit
MPVRESSGRPAVALTIDGHVVEVPGGTTIWEAARQVGIDIPALCHEPRMRPVGVCRMCVVDVGERVLAASCVRECTEGMTVKTATPQIEQYRAWLLRLLLSDYPERQLREPSFHDCRLDALAEKYGLMINGCRQDAVLKSLGQLASRSRHDARSGVAGVEPRAASGEPPGLGDSGGSLRSTPATPPGTEVGAAADAGTRPKDLSSPVIAVDHQACILCDRCMRACDDIQSNHVIGRSGKGYATQIAFDLDRPMGESTCVACGECVAACPTDALTNKPITVAPPTDRPDQLVDSVCPYCGVGCAITYRVRDDQIVLAEGRDSPVNQGRLCVKGRYGWDYALHNQRLTRPLIRRDSHYPKGPLSSDVTRSVNRREDGSGGIVDYAQVLPAFREASWEEALDLVAERLQGIRDTHGGRALAGFGSAKCSNEEAYLFQKLVRAGFGTNNVDHCTRLCHASSVAALIETIGSGAVTNVFADVARADVCLITGSNTTANHPVAATFIKEAARQGTRLIVVDVQRHEVANFATHFAQIRPGTDVAFYNGLMHVLIRDGLIDEDFITRRTEGFDDLRRLVLDRYAPQAAAAICSVPADEITAIARTIGESTKAGGGMIVFWGMGISQHTTGTDNSRCLISLCLMTGSVGRPGTGLHPLRGQNNVQGASDAGLIPMMYPDYQRVADAAVRQKFENAWDASLDPEPGLTVVEIMAAAHRQELKGMYVLGENPFMSDPNINKVREALSRLEFLVVQDIFLTETAEFADVILPASSYFEKQGTYTNTDRRVQLGRKLRNPPGAARPDWQIVCEIGNRMGVPMHYDSPEQVFDEFAAVTASYQGLSHDNLGSHGKLWPCADPASGDGTQILFGDRFPTPTGKGRFVPCTYRPAEELPDDEYPLVLNTGRLLEHWHTGTMTRRSRALDRIQPEPFVAMNSQDLDRLGIEPGQRVRVSSRRGVIELPARVHSGVSVGSVFIPFHFREAAANVLTIDVLDPVGKIPEFKFCAVKVEGV